MLTRMRNSIAWLLLLIASPLHAQANWFTEALLNRPDVHKALSSLDEKTIVDEWVRLTEMPAPSGQERARAEYVRAEIEKLGLTDVRVDELLNVSGVRKGTGGGPSVAFVAHTDTVFPAMTDVRVKRDGKTLRAPGVGDDTGNVVAMLELFRALNRGDIRTKGDLILVASTQEEIGLKGAKHWLHHSGYKPDMFVALDAPSNEIWYGALRIEMVKLIFTSASVHTLFSRDEPTAARAMARAIEAVYDIPLPQRIEGIGGLRLPTINIGMLGGGTVLNAIPAETWFTVDLRSADSPTQERLRAAIVEAGRRVAEEQRVGFRVEQTVAAEDYSRALSREQRLNHPLVQTAIATFNHFRKPGSPPVIPMDLGSTDANIAISLGIPAIAAGGVLFSNPHQMEENAEAGSIVPGVQQLIALAVALTSH